ncbi:hypothetical protein G6F56_012536 [Rhizopus delemar]|nr:hypothetical protein G6F56_012536 [Rhizopus delemar]
MDMSSEAPTEPLKKRTKIMSACAECRRKKTKCNGEQPCRNCQRASATCIYPTAPNNDDKRNVMTRAALESIEERLKNIEDMLTALISNQHEPMQQRLPPIQNLSKPTETKNLAYSYSKEILRPALLTTSIMAPPMKKRKR